MNSSLLTIQKQFIESKGYWSPPAFQSLSYFYELDHILAESQANKKTFSLFSRLDSVERSNEKTLIDHFKEKLITTRKNIVNANTSSMLFTSCMYPTRKDTPNIAVFDEEIEKIVNWLESNDGGFKAIGVHGMCGIGKTTLVKMVLDDQRVGKKYKKPMWVCLYDLKSKDEMGVKIIKEMLAQLNDDPDLLTEEHEDDWLVERLYGKLKAMKKFLIVLNGVWHCNDWFNDLYDNGKVGGMSKLLFF